MAPPSPAVAATAGAAASSSSTAAANEDRQGDAAAATSSGPNEEELRKKLRAAMSKLKGREPLEPTYQRLLMNGIVTPRKPVLPKDRFYSKKIHSCLRERVERYVTAHQGKDPFDRIAQRKPLEESAMRAALTLRDAKEHEQTALLEATLAAMPRRYFHNAPVDEATRKRHMEGIAMFLQSREQQQPPPPSKKFATAAGGRSRSPMGGGGSGSGGGGGGGLMEQTERARQQAELERKRREARIREEARRKREEEDRKQRLAEIQESKMKQLQQQQQQQQQQQRGAGGSSGGTGGGGGGPESPQQALYKIYYPVFKKLWDMEFPHLGGINPFRVVIDRDNCASVGAPDYFDIVERPMNLTYIQQKVERMEYATLRQFFDDVDLLIQNALLYNSDPSNPYHVAAQEMKKRYMKIVKKVLHTIKLQQQAKQQQAQGR